jgi:hypothetical protein
VSDSVTLPKPYLVVLALYELGGEADLETVTVKAFEMFPGLFTWKSYPEYPDKDVVRVSLSDAKKAKFGRLVSDQDLRAEGGHERGRTKRYALTESGLTKAKELTTTLEGRTATAEHTSIEYKRVISPILQSSGFGRFVAGVPIRQIGRQDFLNSFKLFPDATPFIINGRLARAERLVESVSAQNERGQLHQYIKAGRNAFEF